VVLEPDEIARWERMARALASKADDAEGLAQVLQVLEVFDAHVMAALDRLTSDDVYSYAYLAQGLGMTRQGLHQRHARYRALPRPTTAPQVTPTRGGFRWRCRCAAWDRQPTSDLAQQTATAHLDECVLRDRPNSTRAQAAA
jgi:hypothetical protein